MHYALDEMFDVMTARTLDVLAQPNGDKFSYLLDFAPGGTQDEDIPALCARENIDILISENHTDFGAKKALYQTLIDQGVHVVIVRSGKLTMHTETQVSFISQGYRAMRREFTDADQAGEKILLRVTLGATVRRNLEDLVAEFEKGKAPTDDE